MLSVRERLVKGSLKDFEKWFKVTNQKGDAKECYIANGGVVKEDKKKVEIPNNNEEGGI
jgi:hypothetical protein